MRGGVTLVKADGKSVAARYDRKLKKYIEVKPSKEKGKEVASDGADATSD